MGDIKNKKAVNHGSSAPTARMSVVYVIKQQPAGPPQLGQQQVSHVLIVPTAASLLPATRFPHPSVFPSAPATICRSYHLALPANQAVQPGSSSPYPTSLASQQKTTEPHPKEPWPSPLIPSAPPPPPPPPPPPAPSQTEISKPQCLPQQQQQQPIMLHLGSLQGGRPGGGLAAIPTQMCMTTRPAVVRQVSAPPQSVLQPHRPSISVRQRSEPLAQNPLTKGGKVGSKADKNEAILRQIVAGLLHCSCRDPSTLHPVCCELDRPGGDREAAAAAETVEAEDLLTCERCQETVSVPQRLAGSPALPKTVAELRRLFKGQLSCGGTKQPYQMVKVYDIDELSPGCQIAFRRALGYYHHAIVTDVKAESFDTVEYNLQPGGGGGGGDSEGDNEARSVGDSGRGGGGDSDGCSRGGSDGKSEGGGGGNASGNGGVSASFIRVLERCRQFAKEAPQLYRVDYRSLDCFSPETVVSRARQQMDRSGYSLVSSNCEHLAVWAKTGVWESFQRRNLERWLLRAARHSETHQSIIVLDPGDEEDEGCEAVPVLV